MFNEATIDYITHSCDMAEFALYLVEKRKWSEPVRDQLLPIQQRIYTVVDAVLDGQLASDYPDSRGKRIRIEVVFMGEIPHPEALRMIDVLDDYVCSSPEHAPAGIRSGLLSALRIVSSAQ